ncbi:MAG: glutaminase, partial [Rikenellaceae bacterium]
LSTHITSMMATVGLYENTGDWMFTTGLPAKSGVGGGILGVIPGVMGIAAFAPPLDNSGNSVKAQKALRYISNRLNLNVYSPYRCTVHQHEYVYV